MKEAIIEVCVDSVAGAIAAQEGGAHRIELCSDLVEGGVTPSYGLIKLSREAFKGKLYVLIRPRGADFCYSQDEVRVMCEDIEAAASLGADGVVFGCLTPEGEVHMDHTQQLLALSRTKGLDVTFHRAFDMSKDLSASLQQLAALGIPRVLTSGGAASAAAGAGMIAQLVGESAGRVAILVGGGVTEENAAEIISRTGVNEVHTSAKRSVFSPMRFRKPTLTLCATQPPSDWLHGCADAERVRSTLATAQAAVAKLPE